MYDDCVGESKCPIMNFEKVQSNDELDSSRKTKSSGLKYVDGKKFGVDE